MSLDLSVQNKMFSIDNILAPDNRTVGELLWNFI